MTDHDALLAAIKACPEDDTPRLIYADWLEENGDAERAAAIRMQIDAARHEKTKQCRGCGHLVGELSTSGPEYCVSCALYDVRFDNRHPNYRNTKTVNTSNVEALLQANPHIWREAAPSTNPVAVFAGHPDETDKVFISKHNGLSLGWHRGFIDCVTGPTEDWFRAADEIIAGGPAIQLVTLTTPVVPPPNRTTDEYLKGLWGVRPDGGGVKRFVWPLVMDRIFMRGAWDGGSVLNQRRIIPPGTFF